MTDICWLCKNPAKLCESHVIPKFVFRWLINSGGTPYLRSGERPNVRRQDGDKHFLYCKECEGILSKFENQAKRRIFDPATRRESIHGSYGAWLSRFACSLAIRTIHSQQYRGIIDKYKSEEIQIIAAAEKTWRKFLLGEVSNPAQFKLHMIYIGCFDSFDAEDLPQNWNTWVHRSVERDIIYTESGGFLSTFTKLGPLIFLGRIIDENKRLRNDFLRCQDGVLEEGPGSNLTSIWHFLLDRAKNADVLMASISDKQRAISEKEVEKNFSHFAESDLAKTLFDDYRQFGPKK